MKKCPFCAEEIQDEAIVCKHCGRDLFRPPVVNRPYRKTKEIPSCLFAIAILGGFCFFIFICSIFFSINGGEEGRSLSQATTITKTVSPEQTAIPKASFTPKASPTAVIDSSVKAIMDSTGLSQKDAETALSVIESVGFEQVSSLVFLGETEAIKVYDADLGYNQTFRVSIANKEIVSIDNPTMTFYDKSMGGVLDQITNYVLKNSEKSDFKYLAEDIVLLALKSPSTAKFPGFFEQDQWKTVRERDIVWVQSWVDAQNSFGAMIRSEFVAQFSYITQELLYLNIDGEVVYGSLQEP